VSGGRRTHDQFVRFLLVGAAATLIDFALFIGLANTLGLPNGRVWLAKIASGTVGLAMSFYLNRTWTFAAVSHRLAPQVVKFVAVTLVGVYGIQTGLTHLFTTDFAEPGRALFALFERVGLPGVQPDFFTQALAIRTAAFVLATATSATFDFIGYRFWVFRHVSDPE
jgi:putative flippase GtrA